MTTLLILTDRVFSLPTPALLSLWAAVVMVALLAARARYGGLGRRAVKSAGVLVLVVTCAMYGYYKVFRRYTGMLGRHLPTVTLLAPKAGETIGNIVELRAHATDEPGAFGPIAAVRDVEFWLYHPSFVEQHPGNHESKVLLGSVVGPTSGDIYTTSWSCSNPFTPARDGDHGGGDGTRTYVLPTDGRGYQIQAHGLDDEWRAKPGRPGYSERVTVVFTPCQ